MFLSLRKGPQSCRPSIERWTASGIASEGAFNVGSARLRAELEELDLHVSFGWAAFPDDAAGPVELFRKADDRLYAAKLIQRNHRVVEQLARTRVSPESATSAG